MPRNKPKPESFHLISFHPTSENWHGNFVIANNKQYENKGFVRLSLILLSDGKYRVAVWGNDDIGMSIDVATRNQALSIYYELCSVPEITTSLCESLKLEPF